ncbi:MAG: serine/threonine protein kinase [Opitutae bacterium]|nr:serine/threonine protein kinase [Opitutae bacterium]
MPPREREIFERAEELPVAQREALLASACGADAALRARVEALLAAADEADGFLDTDDRDPVEAPGTRIGAYRLAEKIGEGGFGVVYRAEQERPVRREVALKIIKLGMDTRAVVARFEAERQALALMEHPHIARVFDGGATATGRPYFVMELVSGRSIAAFCREERLSVRARVELFLQVCRAVQHAHQKGVIHRDLKPSNMLVTLAEGRPFAKVIDFGVAKAMREPLAGHTVASRLHLFVGTPAYMSPEQIAAGGLDTRSDVFSLGAVLYELLAGRPPLAVGAFAGLGYLELVRRVREEAAPPPSRHATIDAAEARGDLDQIVLKAIAKDRALRYESAGDLARDLERWLRREPVQARPATFGYHARMFVRRHTRAVAAALAMLAAFAAVSVYYAHRIAAERDRARMSAQRAARVSELLTELLTAPDPFRTPAQGDPMAGLFATTIAQAKRELADEPALRAQILTAVGRVYLRLGQHEPARASLTEAVAAMRASGQRDAGLAQALSQLGVLAREQGDFRAAQRELHDALAVQRALPGVAPNDVAIALVELGRTHLALDEFVTAERLFREALELRRRALGEAHRETAVSYGDLGQALWYQGRLEEARPLLVKCVELHRRTIGGEHPNIGLSMGNLALLERDRGDFASADALYRDALPMVQRTLGARHWRVARVMGNVAYLRVLEGRLGEAEPLLREASAIAQENTGGDRSLAAGLKTEWARLHLARREAAQAEPLLREALTTLRRSYAEDGWRISAVKSLLGAALLDLGRTDEAEPLLRDAATHLPARAGPCGRETQPNRERLERLQAMRMHE